MKKDIKIKLLQNIAEIQHLKRHEVIKYHMHNFHFNLYYEISCNNQ